ncbi:hypothetical protein CEXT_593521 [Caerostris extrusa]|uniref:Uncharacterized protein n=1 Tax=Caerostris extrusa TaxID=172846 RepID=A0AAV4NKG9_CAEEX|nr:hypothetical protein CEXT_593521 [Caerostris extrusa]
MINPSLNLPSGTLIKLAVKEVDDIYQGGQPNGCLTIFTKPSLCLFLPYLLFRREGFKSPTLLSPVYFSSILQRTFSRITWKTVEDYGGGGSKEYNLQRPSTDSLEPTEKQFGKGLPRLPTTTLQIKKKNITVDEQSVFPGRYANSLLPRQSSTEKKKKESKKNSAVCAYLAITSTNFL